jgi:integrase
MRTANESTGDFRSDSGTASKTGTGTALIVPFPALPQRTGSITVPALIDLYMARYAGRDPSRGNRLRFWVAKLGPVTLADLDDDVIHFALTELEAQRGRYYAGKDADKRPIYKAKAKPLAPATINRHLAALSAVLSWAIKQRIAPKDWNNPCKRIEARPENNERVRFLDDKELPALLAACKQSKWPRLYAFVMLALTTGARRGELEGLRWRNVDLDNARATLERSKNGDPRVLPLLPNVVDELRPRVGAPGALVFGSKRRPDVAHNHVHSWHKALKDAGVRNFHFHDLRHSCASYLAQSGATLLEIGDVLGHRNLSVTKRYSHLAVDHKTRLVNRVLGEIK